MESAGEIEIAGRTVRFEGTGWFEHQWGNFRNPHYDVNRYLFMDSETFERSYAFGPAFKLIPERMWTSPKSGKIYPWYGRIETPNGTYWYEPTLEAQEGMGFGGPYIEGVI